MRLMDKTIVAAGKGYEKAEEVAEKVEQALKELHLGYNDLYIVRVTVDKVDE